MQKPSWFVYRASESRGEILLANDRSEFTLPYFQSAESKLKNLQTLSYAPSFEVNPAGSHPDGVYETMRIRFSYAEWLLPALILGAEDEFVSFLLISRAHPEYGMVVDGSKFQIRVCLLRYCYVDEGEGDQSEIRSFLATLPAAPKATFSPVRKGVTNLGYAPVQENNDEEEGEDDSPIEIERPAFQASSKGKVKDLGEASSLAYDDEEEEENDDTSPSISVSRPAFQASSKGKVRNLGSANRPAKAQEEENAEDHQPEPGEIYVSRPAFAPSNQGKIPQLGNTRASQPAVPEEEKEVEEPDPGSIAVSRPAFVPNSKQDSTPKAAVVQDPEIPLFPSARRKLKGKK